MFPIDRKPGGDGTARSKRKHGFTGSQKSAINQDVHDFAFHYEKLTCFDECAVCGVEDECEALVSDIAPVGMALMKYAFENLIERSDCVSFVQDVTAAMVDGFLKGREKICRFV